MREEPQIPRIRGSWERKGLGIRDLRNSQNNSLHTLHSLGLRVQGHYYGHFEGHYYGYLGSPGQLLGVQGLGLWRREDAFGRCSGLRICVFGVLGGLGLPTFPKSAFYRQITASPKRCAPTA